MSNENEEQVNPNKPFQTKSFGDMRDNLVKMQGLMQGFAEVKVKMLERQLNSLVQLVEMNKEKQKYDEEQLKEIMKEMFD